MVADGQDGAIDPSGRRPGGRIFHGWWMVGTLATTELLSWGVLYYAFAALLVPMQQDLGWSRSFLSAGIGWAVLVSGLAAPLVGRLLDRHGARWPMTAGSILGTVALLAWAGADHRATYLLAFTLLGVAFALALYEPAFALVAMWFRRGLSRALLVITIGGGFASTVFLPLTSALESGLGWRRALVTLAIGYGAATILPHALVLRGRPERAGLAPDGDGRGRAPLAGPASGGPANAALDGLTTRAALRDPAFRWLAGAFMLSMVATGAVSVHLVALLQDRGYDAGFAASVAGLVGATAVAGRILITALTRFVPPGLAPTLVIGLQALAFVALMTWPGTTGVLVFVALFGATSGALTIVRAAIVAEYFGRVAYGSIAGVLALGTTLARAGGPVLVGVAYGLSGGYGPPFWGIAFLTAVAAVLMVVADRRHAATVAAAVTDLAGGPRGPTRGALDPAGPSSDATARSAAPTGGPR